MTAATYVLVSLVTVYMGCIAYRLLMQLGCSAHQLLMKLRSIHVDIQMGG